MLHFGTPYESIDEQCSPVLTPNSVNINRSNVIEVYNSMFIGGLSLSRKDTNMDGTHFQQNKIKTKPKKKKKKLKNTSKTSLFFQFGV